jgi:hypothetical protein
MDPFSGEPQGLNGMSNEDVLIDACPREFKGENCWRELAEFISSQGLAEADGWEYKAKDLAVRQKQMSCVQSMLDGYAPYITKMAIVCWMLSEMLVSVPAAVSGEGAFETK